MRVFNCRGGCGVLDAGELSRALSSRPLDVRGRESPDFEIVLSDGSVVYVEVVDASPEAIDENGCMNLDKRRSRPNSAPYRVDAKEFGEQICRVIATKQVKAGAWIAKDVQLLGSMILLVNAGKGPLSVRHYFPTSLAMEAAVPLATASPFVSVIVGDETGAYVWRQ